MISFVSPLKCFMLVLFLSPLSGILGQIKPIKPFEQTYAIIVGVSDYPHPSVPSLNYAHRDAEAFYQFLTTEKNWQVPKENIRLLTNAEAKRGNFVTELNTIVDQLQEADRLIIYFSGHGDVEVSPEKEEEKKGFLLFHDVTYTTYHSSGALSIEDLNAFIQDAIIEKKANVILVTDACRSGSLAGGKSGLKATSNAILSMYENSTRILSCEPDQLSKEGPWGGGRGLFSWFLIKGLKGEADQDRNRYVEGNELEDYIKRNVWDTSGRKQRPVTQNTTSSLRMHRVNPDNYKPLPRPDVPPIEVDPVETDSTYDQLYEQFLLAMEDKHYLYPEEGAAYNLFLKMGEAPAAEKHRRKMKIKLGIALQNTTQEALNEYINTPGSELAKRWKSEDAYQHYPEYLTVA
ncbi:MAG: caspase family protein, partial [Bacteroidota bacterium]